MTYRTRFDIETTQLETLSNRSSHNRESKHTFFTCNVYVDTDGSQPSKPGYRFPYDEVTEKQLAL